MTDTDLDRSYSALSQALTEVGQERAQLLLSMVCLALIARQDSASEVLPLIERARLQLATESVQQQDAAPPRL